MNKSNPVSEFRWAPNPDWQTHTGQRQLLDVDFFMPPPPEIGALVSASTTLVRSTKLISEKKLISIILNIGIVIMLAMTLSFSWSRGSSTKLFLESIIISALSTIGLMGGIWYLMIDKIPKNYCSYIGEKGLAEYELTGDRTGHPKENLLMFTDGSRLYTNVTNWYASGIYFDTSYCYTWIKNTGKSFQITGSSRTKKNVPLTENDRWHFANTSDLAWTNYLISTIDTQLAQNGYIEFVLLSTKDDLESLRVGPDFLEFVSKKDGSQRVIRSDIQNMAIDGENLQFKHQDRSWWYKRGSLIFQYDRIPNHRVFEICLREWLNIEL